jgi:hypothetical protein
MGTFSATFTLTVGSSANVGGFNIVGNPGSVSIATNISRASLAGGVTYNDIADTVTEFTIASTGDCTNSITKEVSPTPTPTPTPTETASGMCWTLVYDSLLPTDLYVRYRDNVSDTTVTELINSLQAIDNGNSTYTVGICVKVGGAYSIPTFVQGGVEQSGGSYTWNMGSECTSAPVCLIN